MGKLADLVTRDFGGAVEPFVNREVSSVATVVTRIFRLDAERLVATVVNLSANKLYVGPFPDVSATKGILLGPNGGQVTLDYRLDFLTVGYEWFALATKDTSPIYTMELIAKAAPFPPPPTA